MGFIPPLLLLLLAGAAAAGSSSASSPASAIAMVLACDGVGNRNSSAAHERTTLRVVRSKQVRVGDVPCHPPLAQNRARLRLPWRRIGQCIVPRG